MLSPILSSTHSSVLWSIRLLIQPAILWSIHSSIHRSIILPSIRPSISATIHPSVRRSFFHDEWLLPRQQTESRRRDYDVNQTTDGLCVWFSIINMKKSKRENQFPQQPDGEGFRVGCLAGGRRWNTRSALMSVCGSVEARGDCRHQNLNRPPAAVSQSPRSFHGALSLAPPSLCIFSACCRVVHVALVSFCHKTYWPWNTSSVSLCLFLSSRPSVCPSNCLLLSLLCLRFSIVHWLPSYNCSFSFSCYLLLTFSLGLCYLCVLDFVQALLLLQQKILKILLSQIISPFLQLPGSIF